MISLRGEPPPVGVRAACLPAHFKGSALGSCFVLSRLLDLRRRPRTLPNLPQLPAALQLRSTASLSLSPPRRTTLASPSPRLCLAPACLPPATQAFLSRLKYDPCSHVDEFQAYLVTEKANFFGMDLGEAQERLAASFGPGAWR